MEVNLYDLEVSNLPRNNMRKRKIPILSIFKILCCKRFKKVLREWGEWENVYFQSLWSLLRLVYKKLPLTKRIQCLKMDKICEQTYTMKICRYTIENCNNETHTQCALLVKRRGSEMFCKLFYGQAMASISLHTDRPQASHVTF